MDVRWFVLAQDRREVALLVPFEAVLAYWKDAVAFDCKRGVKED